MLFRVNISPKKVCLQLTFESVKTQFWVTKTVGQRIPCWQARNSKVPMTVTVLLSAKHCVLA